MLKIFFVHVGVFYAVTYHFTPFEIAFRRKYEVFSAKYDVKLLFVESVCVPHFFDDCGKGSAVSLIFSSGTRYSLICHNGYSSPSTLSVRSDKKYSASASVIASSDMLSSIIPSLNIIKYYDIRRRKSIF